MTGVKCFFGTAGNFHEVRLTCDGFGHCALRISARLDTGWVEEAATHIQKIIDAGRITRDNFESVEVGRPRKGGTWFVNYSELVYP